MRRAEGECDPFCMHDIEIAVDELVGAILDPHDKKDAPSMLQGIVGDPSFKILDDAMADFEDCFEKARLHIHKLRCCMKDCKKHVQISTAPTEKKKMYGKMIDVEDDHIAEGLKGEEAEADDNNNETSKRVTKKQKVRSPLVVFIYDMNGIHCRYMAQ